MRQRNSRESQKSRIHPREQERQAVSVDPIGQFSRSLASRVLVILALASSVGIGVVSLRARQKSLKQQEDHNLQQLGQLSCFMPEQFDKEVIPETKRHVPVVVHRIVPEGDHFGGVYNQFIERGIAGLNEAFEKMKVNFYVQAINDVHDSYIFERLKSTSGKGLKGKSEFGQKLEEIGIRESTPGVINIFVLPEIDYGVEGQASGMIYDLMQIKGKNQIFLSYDGEIDPKETFVHEMGHIFGLFHTHEDQGQRDCRFGGDFVCDTPVDPGPYNEYGNPDGCVVDKECKIVKCGNDRNGVSYMSYNPDPRNYMSYYHDCSKTFSAEQQKIMNCVLQKYKHEMIHDVPGKTADLTGKAKVGCGDEGFKTIQPAIDWIVSRGGGSVEICPGVYHETIVVRGIESTKWYKDGYSLQLTIGPAQKTQGDVIIEGDGQRPFVIAKIEGTEGSNGKNQSKVANLQVKNLIFRNGFLSADVKTSFSLFDFTNVDELILNSVTVRDSKAIRGASIIQTGKEATFEGCTFDGNSATSLVGSFGHLTVKRSTFTGNASSSGKSSGSLFYVGSDDDGEIPSGFKFESVVYNGNKMNGVKLSVIHWEKDKPSFKSVDINDPIENGTCSLKNMKCEKK